MADKVVSLVAAPKFAPDEAVVQVCRSLLARAETGEVRSIAVAVVTSDGGASSGFAFAEEDASLVMLLGASCVLRRELEDILAAINDE